MNWMRWVPKLKVIAMVRSSGEMITQQGVVADRSRLQEGYRSKGRGEGRFQGARKRAGS
jgi:hypothetical protein